MHRLRMVNPGVILLVIAAACISDGDKGTTSGGASANIGRVSVLNAMEPSEAQALQATIDEDINKNADYVATLEANANFEEQVKIRVEGGNPPDIAMYPQPGSVIEQAKAGNGGKESADTAEQPPEKTPDRDQPAKKGGSDDLKRLGMS